MRIADAHTDFLMLAVDDPTRLSPHYAGPGHLSLEKLQQGDVALQLFAAFVDSRLPAPVLVQGLRMADAFRTMIACFDGAMVEATADNQASLLAGEAVGAMLTIEGGEALNGSLEILRVFASLGVRAITLTWNFENELGYPAILKNLDTLPLKPFGRDALKEMNRLNIKADMSHLGEGGFWDALSRSTQPVMASHSNAQALCPHFRNLTDAQIKALIDTNGFIGLNFAPGFLCEGRPATIDDVVAHARHILDLGGEHVLGLGSDFDGIEKTPQGLTGADTFPALIDAFLAAGFGTALTEKIAHQNLFRYLFE